MAMASQVSPPGIGIWTQTSNWAETCETPAKVNESTQVHSHLEEWMVMSTWETLSGSIPKP
jgi:hypothetical protein